MPIEEKRPKNDPLIDVGEKEGAEIELDNNEQAKAAAEEKKENSASREALISREEEFNKKRSEFEAKAAAEKESLVSNLQQLDAGEKALNEKQEAHLWV